MTNDKPIRIWVDGCYDMFHIGHANAIRQAKALGGPNAVMVAGVCNDADILANKGPTVMNEQERYAAVAACKWVDEVVPDAPYQTSLECMDRHNCDICVHGDDITTMADGSDCYSVAKAAGRYKQFKRTQGVSTTELVGRMLNMTTERSTPVSSVSQFLTTSTRISQFSNGKEPSTTDRVVYVHGAFDLFHVGHVSFLKAAKARGDYLIVGVHDDETVNIEMGSSFPIMNVHERALSVLQCRYVDDVIIGAPRVISEEVLRKAANVDVVCHPLGVEYKMEGGDPYKIPKELGIFEEIEAPLSTMTTQTVMERVLVDRELYLARQAKKLGKAAVEEELLKNEKSASV
ncbi:Ethanolamine-phosphate cytidylyltransferase [Podochytrium sp. JEL0797]|nr:Ethanolamine-phosphate cytidylyltransferase [Podochytrium sp. JEL0797]KAJ3070491.1 Ethanolamine-phosphate cytidylyltransferase [Podochytrium sp. JEL0797]